MRRRKRRGKKKKVCVGGGNGKGVRTKNGEASSSSSSSSVLLSHTIIGPPSSSSSFSSSSPTHTSYVAHKHGEGPPYTHSPHPSRGGPRQENKCVPFLSDGGGRKGSTLSTVETSSAFHTSFNKLITRLKNDCFGSVWYSSSLPLIAQPARHNR